MVATIKNRLVNVLLADDGSLDVHSAIDLLAELPDARECKITSLRVFTPLESSDYSIVETEASKTTEMLKDHGLQVRQELILGYPSETIIKYAEEHSPDLIVMGARGAGFFEGLLGSVATNVVHSGKWPVLIVRPKHKVLKKALLVTDGSPSSHDTCRFLGEFPLASFQSLEVMHVVPPVKITYIVEPAGMALPVYTPEDEERLTRENMLAGQEILEKAVFDLSLQGLQAGKVLRTGDPVEMILDYAKSNQIDLVVCGSKGAGNLAGWLLGSVSRELVLRSPCSILVVRSMDEG